MFICSLMFIAALFTMLRHGDNLNIHQQMNEQRRCDTYIQWNITQPQKE